MLQDAGRIEGTNWINEYAIPGMPDKSEVGYAGLIAKKQGRRPVVFLTNGFDTRIDDNQCPERRVSTIYSRRDLEKLFDLQSMRTRVIERINANAMLA